MGWPEMAGKHKNQATLAATAAFAGPTRARSAAAGRKILPAWSSSRPTPPSLARVQ